MADVKNALKQVVSNTKALQDAMKKKAQEAADLIKRQQALKK
jgi:hypothetical protein